MVLRVSHTNDSVISRITPPITVPQIAAYAVKTVTFKTFFIAFMNFIVPYTLNDVFRIR